MNSLFTIYFTLYSILTNSSQALELSSECKHLFRDDFKLFLFRSNLENSPSTNEVTFLDETDKENPERKGTIQSHPCHDIMVSPRCKSYFQKKDVPNRAKMVFIPDNENQDCVVLYSTAIEWSMKIQQNPGSLKEEIVVSVDEKETEASYSTHKIKKVDQNQFDMRYIFVCNKEQEKLEYTGRYTAATKTFNVFIESKGACSIDLPLLRLMKKHAYVTAIIFVVVGALLLLFGLKIFKDYVIVFVPLLLAIVGFQVYMSFVEKTEIAGGKMILTIVLVVLALVVIGALLVYFTNLMYFALALILSVKLGKMLFSLAKKHHDFGEKTYYQYIFMAVVFLIFVGFFFIVKDFFIVIYTSIFGTAFCLISMNYFKATDLDILFEIEISDFEDVLNMDAQTSTFFLMFLCLFLVGCTTQYFLFIRSADNDDKPKVEEQNLNIELDFKN